MKKKMFKIGIMVALFLVIITGCTQSQMKDKVAITQDFVPITDIEEDRYDIYVIIKSMTGSYWEVLLDGTRQAGIDNKCNIYVAGSTLETEWELQEAYIELAVEKGADAIILSPDNSEMLVPVVEKVHNLGIPIIIIDTMVNCDSYDVCYMTDNLFAGEMAAREMLRMLKAQGHSENNVVNVAIELGGKSSQSTNERLAGFYKYWTNYAPDTWHIIDEIKCNDGDEALAVELSEEILEQYSYVDGVFGVDNASTMGLASALLKHNKHDVVMVGFDYSPEVLKIIDDDNYNASVILQRQYEMGYKGVESACLLLRGENVDLKFVDTGGVVLNKDTRYSEEILEIIQEEKR